MKQTPPKLITDYPMLCDDAEDLKCAVAEFGIRPDEWVKREIMDRCHAIMCNVNGLTFDKPRKVIVR